MKNKATSGRTGFLRSAAAAALIGLCLTWLAAAASAGECDEALLRCLGDAAGLLGEGNIIAGLAYMAFCFEGYTFCREFLQE